LSIDYDNNGDEQLESQMEWGGEANEVMRKSVVESLCMGYLTCDEFEGINGNNAGAFRCFA
jgi:hypothetical protein